MYRANFGRVFRNGDADPDWLKAVCFSETPLRELKHFYQAVSNKRNQYKKFGLAFWQERVRLLGGNPVFYVDSQRVDYLKALDDSLSNNKTSFVPIMPLVETFGPLVVSGISGYSDFRWEREWRKQGELVFKFDDVAFGICPQDEIVYWEALVNGAFIFVDPHWDEKTLQSVLRAKAKHLLQHF